MISPPLSQHRACPIRPIREKSEFRKRSFVCHVKFSGLPFGNGIPSYNPQTIYQVSGDEWIKLT